MAHVRARYLVWAGLLALAACRSSRSDTGGAAGSGHPDRPTDVTDPQVAAGAALYARYCALCHGADATGYAADNAPSLVNPTFLASADDSFLARSIELGRPGTAMAGYGKNLGGPLGEGDIANLIAFLRDDRPPLGQVAASSPGDPARGRAIYDATCKTCHGDTAVRGNAIHLANPTFLALASDRFLRHAVANGRPGTPMVAFGDALTPTQIDDVVAYVRAWAAPPPAPPPPPGRPPPNAPVVLNPNGQPPRFDLRDGRFVPAAQVKKALDQKRRLVVVDARPPSDYAREHIPGAVSVPYYELAGLSRLPTDGTWIVAYCACPHHESGVVVDELRKRGVQHSVVLDEGILVWRQRGYPITGSSAGQPPPAAPPPVPSAPRPAAPVTPRPLVPR